MVLMFCFSFGLGVTAAPREGCGSSPRTTVLDVRRGDQVALH